MSMKRTFKTVEEAMDYVYSKERELEVLVLPPDVGEVTDEEDMGEIEIPDESNEDLWLRERGDPTPEAATWKKQRPNEPPPEDSPNENFRKMVKDLEDATPLEIFEHFFTHDLYTHIREETHRYAQNQKEKHDFEIDNEDLKTFLGFLIFSGYHTLPSDRDYWSDDDDLGVEIVKHAMSRNAYLDLKRFIHFQDNSKAGDNMHDKSFKIRPIIEVLSKNFRKWGIFSRNLAVDEMIVKYHGHNPIKQFVKSKPMRFGYKLWALCGDNGYCYNFDLYCGKDRTEPEPLGSRIVKNMLSVVDDPGSHIVYFNSFFTSYTLLCELKDMGFRAAGVIRSNRVATSAEKKTGTRGFYEYRHGKVTVVSWKDNKSLTLATNFDFPSGGEIKDKIPSSLTGGVAHHNCLLENHPISIRSKKWYWCLFTRLIDMAIVNSYILYSETHTLQKTSIKDFRRQVAVAYLKLGHGRRAFKGRPLSLPSTPRKAFDDVRFDDRGHMVGKRPQQRRCRFPSCSRKPTTFCKKCNITLCVNQANCFEKYHSKFFKI